MSQWVHPDTHRIWKFLPHNPPMRGERVLVDGIGRCRVVRARLKWEGRKWTVVGKGFKVKPL